MEQQVDGGAGTRARAVLALGALGVVYGDIGTSPLYAVRESMVTVGVVDEASVLGVASCIVWTLVLVVAVKYLWVVMRADDDGEGGIIALEALATRGSPRGPRVVRALGLLGLLGTALLYGDGMITPAISVLSAVEGLDTVVDGAGRWAVPVTVVVLVGLFALQRRGTGRIGRVCGPAMLVWFGYLAVSGAAQLVREPSVLRALSPTYAVAFLTGGGATPVLALGSVFLVATGSEALYADMGHFGRGPIAWSWSTVVMPGLLLQYLGQAALLLREPEAVEQLFYLMAPSAVRPVVVGVATIATVIASQALISGAFSLTAQAVQLGYLPRVRVVHTSDRQIGQIYVPAVNWTLFAAATALAVGFGSSARLASAYGVAVVLTMGITTVLFAVVARDRLGWSPARTALVCGGFLFVDLLFLVAELDKVPDGGWFPLVVAAVIMLAMTTWRRGTALVARQLDDGRPLAPFVHQLEQGGVQRVPGTAVHMSRSSSTVPTTLLTMLRHDHVVHERVVLLAVRTERVATVSRARRARVEPVGAGVVSVTLRFGFTEDQDVPTALANIVDDDFGHAPDETVYVLGDDHVVPTPAPGMALWRERLFVVMARNRTAAPDHFRLRVGREIHI